MKANKDERLYQSHVSFLNFELKLHRRQPATPLVVRPRSMDKSNVARKAHHRGTTTWFTQGHAFKQWKSTGSLLWVHGLRINDSFVSVATANGFRYFSRIRKEYPLVCVTTIICYQLFSFLDSSTVIEDVRHMCQTGLSTLAIFYFDFRDAAKQDARSLLSSLLVQLCDQSDNSSQVLFPFIRPTPMAPDSRARMRSWNA